MGELTYNVGYWMRDLGAWGYPPAIALMAGVAKLPIPAAMNGMLFGPKVGAVVTWSGAMTGAWLSFELSRRFGRPLVERVVPTSAIAKVDGAVQTASWPVLLVVRLIPTIAFTALNRGLGLTLCRRRILLWTTAIGILPGTLLFVASGEGLVRLYARNPLLAVTVGVLALGIIFATGWRARYTRDSR